MFIRQKPSLFCTILKILSLLFGDCCTLLYIYIIDNNKTTQIMQTINTFTYEDGMAVAMCHQPKNKEEADNLLISGDIDFYQIGGKEFTLDASGNIVRNDG